MKKAILTRNLDNGKQTQGELVVYEEALKLFTCNTLELPWKNNTRKVSCIPKGVYKVLKRLSPKYGDHFHIQDVPNRDLILIHPANYVTDLLGCIAVGKDFVDLNKDGLKDVTSSTMTLKYLLAILPNEFELTIK